MKEVAKKEMNSLKLMIVNWIDSYRKMFDDKGNTVFFYEELCRDIEDYGLIRYVGRMLQTGYITPEEAQEFDRYMGEQLRAFYEECLERDEEK